MEGVLGQELKEEEEMRGDGEGGARRKWGRGLEGIGKGARGDVGGGVRENGRKGGEARGDGGRGQR